MSMVKAFHEDHGHPKIPYELETFLIQSLREQAGLTEDLHALLPELDERGYYSLFNGVSSANPYAQGPSRLAVAVKAYSYCRSVDDAIPAGELAEQNIARDHVWDTSYEVVNNGSTKRIVEVEDNAADLEGIYLLSKLDLDMSCFPTTGDYYRTLVKLKARQEEIQPYLPLLLAMAAIRTETSSPTNWYFNDSWYLWENIDLVKKYPVEKINEIAAETVRRGGFDEGMAQQIVESGVPSLNDGLL